jgi:hypothetical protein
MHSGVMDVSFRPANCVPVTIRTFARAGTPSPGSATIPQIDRLPLARVSKPEMSGKP